MTQLLIMLVVLLTASLVLAGVSWVAQQVLPLRRLLAALAAVAIVSMLVTRPAHLAVSNVVIVTAAMALAPLLGRSLGSAGAIAAFGITVAVVDVLSFGGGLTRQIIQDYRAGSSNLLQYLAVTIPIAGEPTPLVGVSDLLIMAALFLGLTRIHGRFARAALVLLSALALSVIIGLLLGGAAALPFLAAAAVTDAWLASRTRRNAEQPAACT